MLPLNSGDANVSSRACNGAPGGYEGPRPSVGSQADLRLTVLAAIRLNGTSQPAMLMNEPAGRDLVTAMGPRSRTTSGNTCPTASALDTLQSPQVIAGEHGRRISTAVDRCDGAFARYLPSVDGRDVRAALRALVQRRNAIAHKGDLRPSGRSESISQRAWRWTPCSPTSSVVPSNCDSMTLGRGLSSLDHLLSNLAMTDCGDQITSREFARRTQLRSPA